MKKALFLLLALAACSPAPPGKYKPTGPREVIPAEVVLINGCEYYRFQNPDGYGYSSYAPAVRRRGDNLSDDPLPGYTWCYK